MRSLVAVALAACTLAACGFAPNDEFTGRRVGDGIAPWTELGPVQLCLGNEFMGPPDSDPGGLCGDENTTEAPCVSDGDCRSREGCVCGRCIVPYCTAASDCSGGRVCSFGSRRCDVPCADAADCTDGAECINGVCRGRCFVDADCQTGEVCSSRNFCITAACADNGDCLAGERCRVQRVPRVATEPTVLARERPSEPRFTMWLELSDQFLLDRRDIWRAVSPDGIHYVIDPARPVLEDGGAARAPSVIRTPTGYALYYQQGDGAALRVATSSDGVAFGEPATVLVGGGDSPTRAPSAVLLPDGQVAVYYEASDGAAISWAQGAVAGPLTARGAALLVEDVEYAPDGPRAAFWLEIDAVRSPHALLSAGPAGEPIIKLWFSAFGRESADSQQFGEIVPIPPNYSIGYAAAPASSPGRAVPWPYNPVFDRVSAFLDHRSELSPGVVRITSPAGALRDGYLLYYMDADADSATGPVTRNRLGVAGNGEIDALAE